MPPTLKDIARQSGMSVPTVSLILNGHGDKFRESTCQAVFSAADDLNYRPDAIASRVGRASDRRDAVGFLVRSESASRLANAPVYEFMCGVNDVLLEHDQFMVVVRLTHLHEHDGARGPRLIAERFIDGLIVETGLPERLELSVKRYRIPTIWLNCSHHDDRDCVWPDEVHAGSVVTQHLIDLGHRRIMFLPPSEPPATVVVEHFSTSERQQGFEQAMTAAGLEPLVCRRRPDASEMEGAVAASIRDSRSGSQPITAVVTSGFAPSIRLRLLLAEAGLRCPEDFSVATAEDVHGSRRGWPETAGVTCDRYRMGCWAAEMMLSKVEQGGKPQPSRVFKAQLIEGTTATHPWRPPQ